MGKITDRRLGVGDLRDRGIQVVELPERARVRICVIADPVPFGDSALGVHAEPGLSHLGAEHEERRFRVVPGEQIENGWSRLGGTVIEGEGEIESQKSKVGRLLTFDLTEAAHRRRTSPQIRALPSAIVTTRALAIFDPSFAADP
jgi:hypothetical protein